MTRKTIYLALLFLCVLAAGRPVFSADDYLHLQLDATILVADPDAVAEKLAQWAEQAGGYFLVKSSGKVIIRFPAEKLDSLRELIKNLAQETITLASKATDLRESFLEIQSGLSSREEMLQNTLGFLSRADIKGTLAIEKEVIALLKEIEELKGKLRKLYLDRKLAMATINLNYIQQIIPQDVPSSFAWINGIDFYKFIKEGF